MPNFAQDETSYAWGPPEIASLEWLAELGYDDFARSDGIDKETRALDSYLGGRNFPPPFTKTTRYNNREGGHYWPWQPSTDAEREATIVCMLGKLLWCICEGAGDILPELAHSAHHDTDDIVHGYGSPTSSRLP